VTLSLLLILPYFGYVFNFLDPEKIIHRIQDQTLIVSVQSQGPTGARQRAVLDGIEHETSQHREGAEREERRRREQPRQEAQHEAAFVRAQDLQVLRAG
jgi:hypothetical protein